MSPRRDGVNVWHSVQYLGSCRGIPLQHEHDIVILPTLPQHSFLDHAQRTKPGGLPGTDVRLPARR